jgi:hypothetical protein
MCLQLVSLTARRASGGSSLKRYIVIPRNTAVVANAMSLRTYAFQQSKTITDPSRVIARGAGHIAIVRLAKRGCGENPHSMINLILPTDGYSLKDLTVLKLRKSRGQK